MNRPTDIPEDVWDDAGDLIDDWAIEFSLAVVISGNIGHVLHQRIARALVAYGQSRADEARESAAKVADAAAVEADRRMANAIFDYTKRNYASAHVTSKRLAAAIRSQK